MKWPCALVGFTCALLLLLVWPAEASAHAALVASDPGANTFLKNPPAEVALTFSEPIAPGSSSVRLLDATGATVALRGVSFANNGYTIRSALPPLAPGIYNVLWTNVSSIDGHGLQGSFPFTVLNRDGTVPSVANTVGTFGSSTDPAPLADGIAVRVLSLLGLATAAGGALIVLLWGTGASAIRRALGWTVVTGAAVMLAATVLQLVVIKREYTGLGLVELLTQTRIGGYWLMRLSAAALAGGVVLFMPEAPRRAATAVLVALGEYVWAYAATSHAAAGVGSALATALDFVHGLAAVLWIGAVLGVAVAARLTGRRRGYGDLLPRFSLLASLLVFVLLATGLLNGVIEVNNRDGLWHTKYGITLLVKLGLIVILLGVAGYNARWGRRRLLSQAKGEPRRFILTAAAEVALGLAVFAAAAVLTQATTAKSIVRNRDIGPFDGTQQVDNLSVVLNVDPNHTGINTFRVTLSGAAQTPGVADRVRLTFRYQEDQTVGASTLDLAALGEASGVYSGEGPYLPLEGRWRVEVSVARPDADDTTAVFDVRPAGLAVNRIRRGSAWSNPSPGLSWNEFGGLAILFAGCGFALWRGPIRRLGRSGGLAANLGMVAGFGFGTLLLFGVHRHPPLATLPRNPIAADANSLATGRALYQENCIGCHGAVGVPPKGLDLDPYPFDLTVHVPLHPDGQIFKFIADGVPGTAMQSWSQGGGHLTDEQIWHLVNYLRTFTPADR